MTHDQVRDLVRRINPIPDPNALTTVDVPVPVLDRRMDMQVDERPKADRRRENRWRGPLIGIAAAAVVVIGGVIFINTDDGGAGDEAAAPPTTPTTEPAATTTRPTSTTGATFVVSEPADSAPGITATAQASSWTLETEVSGLFKGLDGILMWSFPAGTEFYVPTDPCHSVSTMPANSATTPDEIASALAAQTSRNATAPADVTIDGYAGKSLTVHVPDDAEFAECEGNTYLTYATGDDPGARSQQSPGQIDEIWIVDVDGNIVVIDALYRPATSTELIDEMRSIAGSATFQLASDDVAVELPAEMETPIDAGAYFADIDGDAATPMRGALVISDTGWLSLGAGLLREAPGGSVDFGSYVSLMFGELDQVWEDPCAGGVSTSAGTTAGALGDQFAAMPRFITVEGLAPVTAFGREGFHLVLEVPADCSASDSHNVWLSKNWGERYYQVEGQIVEYWFLDAEGTTVMVEATRPPKLSEAWVPEINADLDAVLDTLTISS